MLNNLRNELQNRTNERQHNRFIAEDAGVYIQDPYETNIHDRDIDDLDEDDDDDEIDPKLMAQIDKELDALVANSGQSADTVTEEHVDDMANRLLNDDIIVTETAGFEQEGTGFEYVNYHIPHGPKDITPSIDQVIQKDINHSNQVGDQGHNEPARVTEQVGPIKQNADSILDMIEELYNK